MNAQQLSRELHLIVAQHCPSDHGASHATLFKRSEEILSMKQLSMQDRATIARVLPSALLSTSALGPVLKDSAVGPNLIVELFAADKDVPCDSAAIKRTDLRTWVAGLMDAAAAGSPQRTALLFAYLRLFSDEKPQYSDVEVKKAGAAFKEYIKALLETYIAEKLVFSVEAFENVLRLPVIDVLLKSAEAAPAVQLVLNTMMNGDVEALKKTKDAGFVFTLAQAEVVTRDIAVRNAIQTSNVSIKCTTLYELFHGNAAASSSAAYDGVVGHKLIRKMLFEQGLCKLDDIEQCVTPYLLSTNVKVGDVTSIAECKEVVKNWRDSLDVVVNAMEKASADETEA